MANSGPHGLVFGPQGGLYVSVFSESSFSSADPAGYILRFDTATGQSRVIARNDGDGILETGEIDLHNPEGLAFGPGGRLYVTSNRIDANTLIDENTSIVVIDPLTGLQLDRMAELTPNVRPDNPTRVFAQAILSAPTINSTSRSRKRRSTMVSPAAVFGPMIRPRAQQRRLSSPRCLIRR